MAANGCTSDRDSVELDINKLQASLTPGPTMSLPPVVVGDNIDIQASVTGGTPPYTYHWISPSRPDKTDSSFVEPAADMDYHFEVYATDANGCVSDTAVYDILVTGYDPLDVELVSIYGDACIDGAAILEATITSTPTTPDYVFEWYKEGSYTPLWIDHTSSTTSQLIVYPDEAAKYHVKVRDNSDPLRLDRDTVTLNIDGGKTAAL